MRWIARRTTAWVVAATMAVAGPGRPGEPAPAWSPTVGTPAPATPGRLKHDTPERAGPPILIPPPDVTSASPPAGAELVAGPPIVVAPPDVTKAPPPTRAELPSRPDQVRVIAVAAVQPAKSPELVPPALPPSAQPESVEVIPAPPVLSTLPGVPTPPAEGPPCPNPWAKVPVVQPFPRLGLFLVPGSGPGYYSFADVLHGNWREKPPTFPYPPFALQPPSGFDADYRHLDNPTNTQVDPFDVVKRIHPTSDTMVTVGGQHSARFMYEVDSRLTPRDNTYLLYRNRVWADVWYRDQVRVYGEFISAQIAGNELPPLPIDVNRADIQNLFVEVKVAEVDGQPVHLRVGRQEMLFGSQRLVSTLDWGNTRRTFEGVRGFTRSEAFDADVFWTRPVVVEPGDLDSADEEVQFYGAWATYRPVKGQLVDVYYLGLTDERLTRDRFLPAARAPRGTVEVHTFGARYAGNDGPLLFDFEGMVQTGQYVRRDHCAHAWVTAVGWEFQDHPWRPQVWAAYDYYSGTPDPTDGDHRTFHQLFPFGHYYLGYLDVVGQQNIRDLNFQLVTYPDHWITVVFQWHHFRLAEERDFLYNAAGRPTRRSPTGAAGGDVGREFDVRANFHLTPHQDLLVGYSKLFAGDFIRATGPAVSPELFYLMYNVRW